MDTVIYLQKLCGFVTNRFPLLALVSLLAITLILVFREKRRRKLKLSTPKENRRIDELLKNKRINEEEAEKLKAAANALPEVVEEYPLPDIHLRLTAALAKTFSLLKILLIASQFYIVYVIWRIPACADIVRRFKSENPKLFIVICVVISFLIILFSVIQFAASIYITRGGRKSRIIIAFIWLFDLALLPIVMSGVNNNIVYSIVSFSACAYSLWILYLRPDAGTYIDFKAKTPGWVMKSALILVFFFCFVSGTFLVKGNIKSQFFSTSTTSYPSISGASTNNCSTLNKVVIIAAAPDEETAETAKTVYNMLQEKFPEIDFKYLKFKESFPENEIKFDQFIFISKAKIVNPKNLKGSTSFNVMMHGRLDCHNLNGPYLDVCSGNSIDGSMLVTGSIPYGQKTITIKGCAESIVRSLSKEYRKAENLYTHFSIPDFMIPALKKIPFDNISFLKGAWRIGNFRSVNFDNYSIYIFPLKKDREKQRKAIIKELERLGWNYLAKNSGSNIIAFNKTVNYLTVSQIKVYLSSRGMFRDPDCGEFFGYFICASRNEHKYTDKEAGKFKKFDFKDYLQCVILYNLAENEAIDVFERVYNDKSAGFDMLKTLYKKTDSRTLKTLYEKNKDKRFLKELVSKRDNLLIKMGNILKTQINKADFPRKILELATLIEKENKYPLEKHPAFVHFRDKIVKAKLHREAEQKKYSTDKITVSGNKSPVIIEISNIGKLKDKRFVVVSRSKTGNKLTTTLKLVTTILSDNTTIKTNISAFNEKRESFRQYVRFYNCSKGFSGSLCGDLNPGADIKVDPDSLGFFVDYEYKSDEFEFKVVFKEK